MSQAPSMPLFCGDYMSDTYHFNLEQHGAYLLLLMITWRNNGQPLPDNDDLICQYLHVGKDRWVKKIRPVLEPKFDLSEGVWRSVRLEKEWNFVQKRIEVKKENGAKGGRPKSLKSKETDKAIGSVEDNLNHNLTESTHTHTQESKNTEASASVVAPPAPAPTRELVVVDKAKKPRAKAKARLSEDWFLPMEWGQWALDEGADTQLIRRAADRFKSHWLATGKPMADWKQAWCNWIRRDLESNSNVKQSSSSKSEDLFDGLVNAAFDIMDAGAGAHNVVPLRTAASAW
jgi:uncharacterized protein YdaU (DUF1376 family)